MSPLTMHARAIEPGSVRCQKCGRVHDCYRTRDGGISWADPHDGHAYHAESWEAVAFRYGYSPMRERDAFPPTDPTSEPPS